MNNATVQLENEIAVARQKIEANAAQRRDAIAKSVVLEKAVDVAEQALLELEAKRAFFTARKQQLKDQLLMLWGRAKGDLSLQLNFDPTLGIVESHGTIAAIDAALADAPRAKKHLDDQLRAAKDALASFQRLTTN